MPLEKLQFQPGIVSETTPYDVGHGYVDSNLIRWRNGRPATMGGWSQIGTPAINGVCRSLLEWASLSGSVRLALGTNSNVYILQAGTYYDITPLDYVTGPVDASVANGYGIGLYGVGTYGTPRIPTPNTISPILSLPATWSLDNFGEDLILNPRGGPIYNWTSTLTDHAVRIDLLPGASDVPSVANGVFVSKILQNVVAMGCTPLGSTNMDPMQVRWSDTASYLNWTPTTGNSAGGYRIPSGSTIVGWIDTYYETLIFTDTTVYTMQYSTGDFVYSFQPIGRGMSIVSPKAAISNGSSVFWMDNGAFWQYNGSISELVCPLKQHLFRTINILQQWKVFAAHNHAFSEVMWFYPSINSNEIDSYIMFNYRENLWSVGTLIRTAWSDSGRTTSPIAINPAGNLYFHEFGDTADGAALPFYLRTGDIDIQNGTVFVMLNRLIPDFKWTGSGGFNQQLTINYLIRDSSNDPQITAKTLIITPNDSDRGYVDARVRGRRVAFEITGGNAGTAWTLGACEAEYQPAGRR